MFFLLAELRKDPLIRSQHFRLGWSICTLLSLCCCWLVLICGGGTTNAKHAFERREDFGRDAFGGLSSWFP